MPYRPRGVVAAVYFAALILVHAGAEAQSQVFDFEQGVAAYTGFDDTTIFSESDNSGAARRAFFLGQYTGQFR